MDVSTLEGVFFLPLDLKGYRAIRQPDGTWLLKEDKLFESSASKCDPYRYCLLETRKFDRLWSDLLSLEYLDEKEDYNAHFDQVRNLAVINALLESELWLFRLEQVEGTWVTYRSIRKFDIKAVWQEALKRNRFERHSARTSKFGFRRQLWKGLAPESTWFGPVQVCNCGLMHCFSVLAFAIRHQDQSLTVPFMISFASPTTLISFNPDLFYSFGPDHNVFERRPDPYPDPFDPHFFVWP